MEWIFALIIIAVTLLAIANPGGRQSSYRTKGPLFSPSERSFLGVLDSAVADNYRVFGKVRIADILSPQKGMSRKRWQLAFNKISAKHFDYVLCCKKSLKVVAAIELDDKSHKKQSSLSRDKFIESACESANLTLIRFPARAGYSVQEVRATIEDSLATNQPHPTSDL